jgi:hypothetical protein
LDADDSLHATPVSAADTSDWLKGEVNWQTVKQELIQIRDLLL